MTTTDDIGDARPGQPEIVTRFEADLIFRDLVTAERYQEALPLGEQVIALTAEEFGEESAEYATALSNLGEIQRRAGLHEDSERNLLDAVAIFRELKGEFTESVINPLIGLGASYHARGEYLQAVTAFQDARTVNRRVFGLLNEKQIVLLNYLATSLVSMKRYEEADQQQQTALRIMERVHGEAALEILPFLYAYADWLRNGYRFHEERNLYTRAMDIIREHEGKDSARLGKPLREVGNSFRIQKLPEGRGISSMNRALEILESSPTPDAYQIAQVLRDIGDWHVAFGKVGLNGDEYRRAWQLLGGVEEGERLRREWFTEPRYVLHESPSTQGTTDASEPGTVAGHVLLAFDVDERGRTSNVVVLESSPPGFKDDTAIRSISRSRFRPRLVNGEILRTNGVKREFSFHYTPEE